MCKREEKKRRKDREVLWRRHLGNIWWCHGKVTGGLLRIYECLGVLAVRNSSRRTTDMLSYKHVHLHQEGTQLKVCCQMWLIPVLVSLNRLMWLDLVLLFCFITSLLFVDWAGPVHHVPTRWESKNTGNIYGTSPWPTVHKEELKYYSYAVMIGTGSSQCGMFIPLNK